MMTVQKTMTRREMCKIAATSLALTTLGAPGLFASQESRPKTLPEPNPSDGPSLLKALQERKTTRQFSEEELPIEIISELLWAADGINRPEAGKRTAPSAWNWQNIDIYLSTADGVYLYDAKAHKLRPHLSEDLRKLTGTQGFVTKVPVNLIYVANNANLKIYDFKAKKKIPAPDEEIEFYSIANAGFISQNVYLYAAAKGLGTVTRGLIDRKSLSAAMKLGPKQKIILAQSVGYPAVKPRA